MKLPAEFEDAKLAFEYKRPYGEIRFSKYAWCAVREHRPRINRFSGHSPGRNHYTCECGLWEWVVKEETSREDY